MKRYRYSTNNTPESFSAALDYLKMTKEFTGTADYFFFAQDCWNTIPINLDMYFTYRPYLEIMGLQDQLDNEIKRIIGKDADKWYPYNEKYGYYAPVVHSGNNIIQIPCPTMFDGEDILVPYDKWETDKEAIEWLSKCIVEEIQN